ncbi:hypothetical protein E4U42_007124 [Claviceps africana]|uniref:BZIP domain-containing protein n=1 Tax=Claviceps africana TaxID=83212 RepID=A0A8K0NIS9_9HYPO|nr:hypothetical protein E4U42_007124 [Claviceps africana]
MIDSQASPMVKFEASPAESSMSIPGDNLSSLFGPSTPSVDVMTPQSIQDDLQTSKLPVISDESENRTPSAEDDTSVKKQTKKRKSWGQVLPEPKTNLPPRKRAKTEDEKEQRRVERVLRNRRAAQSSRERKRLEVEALEIRNQELETLLADAQKANLILVEELNRVRRDSGVATPASSPLNQLYETPLALSQELFSSHDGHNTPNDSAVLLDQLIKSTANPTVNPASLSPELTPIPDEPTTDSQANQSEPSEDASSTSPDLAQHPAEMLFDLQCHKSGTLPKPFLGSPTAISPLLAWTLQLRWMVLSASAILSASVDDDYLAGDSAAGLSSQSAFELFDMDDFVNDEANNVVSDIMAASDYAAADHGLEPTDHDFEIQIPYEHSCLQPQSGASLVGCDDGSIAGGDDRVVDLGDAASATRDQVSELTRCLKSIVLPSRETLMALLWALKMEHGKIQQRNVSDLGPTSGVLKHQLPPSSAKTYVVLKKPSMKRTGKAAHRNAKVPHGSNQ